MRISASRTTAEGLCTVSIRKYIMGMAVTLHHRQRCMQRHPENQIRQLTKSAANITANMAQKQHHSLLIPFSFARLPDELPIAECLTRMENNTVQVCCCQLQINDLIPLPFQLVTAQIANQRRRVRKLNERKRGTSMSFCPLKLGRAPQQITFSGIISFAQPQAQSASANRRAQSLIFWIKHGNLHSSMLFSF